MSVHSVRNIRLRMMNISQMINCIRYVRGAHSVLVNELDSVLYCYLMYLMLYHIVLIRPRRSTMYVDVAYSCRLSSVVCRSVCHTSQPCKSG